MNTYYVERKGVRRSEAVIPRTELESLRRLARRGEAYERAARDMRSRHADMLVKQRDAHLAGDSSKVQWCGGWLAAIRELSELVLRPEEMA